MKCDAGLGVRFGTAFLALLGSKADWGERLAMSLVWLSAVSILQICQTLINMLCVFRYK